MRTGGFDWAGFGSLVTTDAFVASVVTGFVSPVEVPSLAVPFFALASAFLAAFFRAPLESGSAA